MLNNASAAVVLLDSAIKRCSFDSVVLVSVRFQEVAYYAFEQPYFPLKASKCLFCLPPLPVHRESSFFQCLHITISLRKFNIKRNKTLLLDSTIQAALFLGVLSECYLALNQYRKARKWAKVQLKIAISLKSQHLEAEALRFV